MSPSSTNGTSLIQPVIEEALSEFDSSRLAKARNLKLKNILKRKNPYLFRYKNFDSLKSFVQSLTDASLSSSEETLFGNALERIAIGICEQSYGGRKSMVTGIDLEFERNEILHIISIKSGPNWGNSAQQKQMALNFRKARQVFHQGASRSEIRAIEGCCYGVTGRTFDKGTHQKMCGREFWELISGKDFMYQTVFKLIGEISDTMHKSYESEYESTIERLTEELSQDYALENGEINWDKILNLNAVNPIPLFLYPETDSS